MLTNLMTLENYIEVLEHEKYRRSIFDEMVHEGLDNLIHELAQYGDRRIKEVLKGME